MPLLLENFPVPKWLTANSEDYMGPDVDGIFGPKSACVVATRHGGKDGQWGLLTPYVYEAAQNRGGITSVDTVILKDVSFRDLLNGYMRDRTIDIFSYEQALAGECPRDGREYVIVRPLAIARQTEYGVKPIARLTDKEGIVNNSQLIVDAGGLKYAQNVITAAKKRFPSQKFGTRHPFNESGFNPAQAQGSVLKLGANTFGISQEFTSLKPVIKSHPTEYQFVVVSPDAIYSMK